MPGVSILCTCFMWVLRTLSDLYPLPQTEQVNGLSPVCSRSWISSVFFVLSIFSQWLHLNRGSSCFNSCFLGGNSILVHNLFQTENCPELRGYKFILPIFRPKNEY